jgi:hypothetical protein
MIKFYSSHCPKCIVLENQMKNKKIDFELVEDENVYMPIAQENNIMSMPFAEIDGQIYNTIQLQKYIMEK